MWLSPIWPTCPAAASPVCPMHQMSLRTKGILVGLVNATQTAISMAILPRSTKDPNILNFTKMAQKSIEKYAIVIVVFLNYIIHTTCLSVSKDWDHLPQLSWQRCFKAHQFPTYICGLPFRVPTIHGSKGLKDKQLELDPFGMVIGTHMYIYI